MTASESVVEALEFIAEGFDVGRHDGLPEDGPVHDADTMFAVARAALARLNNPAEQDAREAVARVVEDAAREGIRNYCLDRTDFTAAPFVRRILALTQAAPDGWRLVPVEPAPEMIEAGCAAAQDGVGCTPWGHSSLDRDGGVHRDLIREYVARAYTGTLSASPAPPAQGAGG